ncbi:MAG: methyltransferase domain-containing protein [Alphaproteobacteria bacterium]|nr:methyltransferase domain-containing protein [Alphaproteobacteria bacterium]
MFADILSLQNFYQTPLGDRAQRLLRARVAEMWPNLRHTDVLALGYGTPLLPALVCQARAVYAFMPAEQGVSPWPLDAPNLCCLVDLDALPLPDNCLDRVVLLHALEGAADPDGLLREVWRVMKSGGRLLAIIPNRRGLWAQSDLTPFGNGQPYSAGQIKRVLQNQGFCVERLGHALYAPPWMRRAGSLLGDKIEKYAARLFPGFGGAVIVEASKQLYAPTPVKSRARRLVLPLPFPAARPLPT